MFLLNIFAKQKIENRLQELDAPISYADLGVNIYTNRYRLEEVQTQQARFSLGAKDIIFTGVSYSSLLFGGELKIDKLEVREPQIIYFKGAEAEEDKSSDEQIRIGEILLSNGNFSSKENDTSTTNSIYVSFSEVKLEPLDQNIDDFEFENYNVELDSVYLKMNEEHYIDMGSVGAENGNISITDFAIVPFFPKAEFDQQIPYEKDRIDLKVPDISLEKFKLEGLNDTLHVGSSKMTISDAFLEIYRNKLLKDDERRKPLYNELLREAPVKLDIEKILVENSEIIYEEQIQEGREAAVIRFTDVSAEIKNLSNLRAADSIQPVITANASFMRGTPVHLNWTFPVFEAGNNFNISGGFGALEGEALDPFLVPALDLQARGDINSIDFSFKGNEDTMTGTFTLNYDELEVELLKEEGEEKRSFLSAIANLFVKNEAEPEDESIGVVRNKQRSFWNYVWLGLREGFMETVSRL